MELVEVTDLEELQGKEWEYKGRKFNFVYINGIYSYDSYLKIFLHNFRTLKGDVYNKEIICVSEENLSELELFGLKVILNEKPKLTIEDKAFLKAMPEDLYIARGKDGMLVVYGEEPCMASESWISDIVDDTFSFPINGGYLKFITWESERFWMIQELMKLEVIE